MGDTKNTELDILTGVIDPESKTYSFEKTISVQGEKLTGTFTAKYMGITARLRLGTLRAKLLDGAPNQSIDILTDDIAYMIAYLTVSLVKVPKWWNYDNLDDIEDLRAMYDEVNAFMRSFRDKNDQSTNAKGSKTAAS